MNARPLASDRGWLVLDTRTPNIPLVVFADFEEIAHKCAAAYGRGSYAIHGGSLLEGAPKVLALAIELTAEKAELIVALRNLVVAAAAAHKAGLVDATVFVSAGNTLSRLDPSARRA
jgi:hypothetical protein